MKRELGLLRAEQIGLLEVFPIVPRRAKTPLIQEVHLDPRPLEFAEESYEEAAMSWFEEPSFQAGKQTMLFVHKDVSSGLVGHKAWWGWTVHPHRGNLYLYQSVVVPFSKLEYVMTLEDGTLYCIETRQLIPWSTEENPPLRVS